VLIKLRNSKKFNYLIKCYRFVNQITKINQNWYKDVRMMMKFLENPDKIYNPKDEDYK